MEATAVTLCHWMLSFDSESHRLAFVSLCVCRSRRSVSDRVLLDASRQLCLRDSLLPRVTSFILIVFSSLLLSLLLLLLLLCLMSHISASQLAFVRRTMSTTHASTLQVSSINQSLMIFYKNTLYFSKSK